MEDQPQYELDSDTLALLTTVLELAMMTSNLQLDGTNSQSVLDIVFQTAHRFGIEFDILTIDETAPKTPAGIDPSRFNFDIKVSFTPDADVK